MELRKLGDTDIQISTVIMGAWQAGKRGWVGIEDDQIVEALRSAFEAGVTTFDTAESYGDGYSERLVGEALADVRDRVVYATKVFPTHLKPQQVIKACEGSLKNLQTDYIDLYQIHWPAGSFDSEEVPIEETMGALNQLKQQGKIRAIGVSNFSQAELEAAMQYGKIESLQPPYSLFWRHVETDAMPFCIENDLSILAYSSLAQGLLTGKFDLDHDFPKGDVRASNRLFQGDLYQRAQAALAELRPIAERYQTTLGNLCLAWLIAQPQTCAIVGARNAAQSIENALAADLSLDPEDIAEMDAIAFSVTDHIDENPVMWNLDK